MKRLLLVLILLGLALSACSRGPSPKDLAEARRIEQEIRDKAAQEEAKRIREQEQYEATKGAVAFAKQITLVLVGIAFAVTASVTLFMLAWRVNQVTKSVVTKSKVWSLSVPLDEKTGQYPILILKGHVIDPNTRSVIELGQAQEPDRQLSAGAHYTRALAVATRGAVEVAQATKNSQATDAIFTTSGAIPLIGGAFDREREIVQNSPLPAWVKNKLDQALVKRAEEQEVIDQ